MITLFIISIMFKMLCWLMYVSIKLAAVIIEFIVSFIYGFITGFITSFITEYRKAKQNAYKQTIEQHNEIKLLTVSKYR